MAEANIRVGRGQTPSLLGEAQLLAGRPRDAMVAAQHGLAGARERGERADEARNLRALAEATEELGIRPLVARCHLGLGQLHARTAEREHAREHLGTATTMLREMGMTYWLTRAEAELEALA